MTAEASWTNSSWGLLDQWQLRLLEPIVAEACWTNDSWGFMEQWQPRLVGWQLTAKACWTMRNGCSSKARGEIWSNLTARRWSADQAHLTYWPVPLVTDYQTDGVTHLTALSPQIYLTALSPQIYLTDIWHLTLDIWQPCRHRYIIQPWQQRYIRQRCHHRYLRQPCIRYLTSDSPEMTDILQPWHHKHLTSDSPVTTNIWYSPPRPLSVHPCTFLPPTYVLTVANRMRFSRRFPADFPPISCIPPNTRLCTVVRYVHLSCKILEWTHSCLHSQDLSIYLALYHSYQWNTEIKLFNISSERGVY